MCGEQVEGGKGFEVESTAGGERDCRDVGKEGGTGGEGWSDAGVWGGTRETGLEPVCGTGCQLLAGRRDLVRWVVLVEGRKRHSGSSAAKLKSCCDSVLDVNGVGEEVARVG